MNRSPAFLAGVKTAAARHMQPNQKQEPVDQRRGNAVMVGIGASTGASMLGSIGAGALGKRLRENGAMTPAQRDSIAQHMKLKNLPEYMDLDKDIGGSHFRPDLTGRTGGSVGSPMTHSPEYFAHEMGHAKNYSGREKLVLARPLGSALGGAAGFGMALGGERGGKMVKAAPLVAALGQMPTLIDEGAASYRAMKALRAAGINGKQLSSARGNLMKAYGTYALGAMAAVAPSAAMAAYRWKKNDKPEPTNNQPPR